jgi:hypothetical protein
MSINPIISPKKIKVLEAMTNKLMIIESKVEIERYLLNKLSR